MTYDPATLNGVNEATLRIHYYNENTQQWVALPSTVNTGNQTVTAMSNHFTKFAVVIPMATAEPTAVPTGLPVEPTPTGNPPTVPEPATFVLFGIGLVSIVGLLRRKLKK